MVRGVTVSALSLLAKINDILDYTEQVHFELSVWGVWALWSCILRITSLCFLRISSCYKYIYFVRICTALWLFSSRNFQHILCILLLFKQLMLEYIPSFVSLDLCNVWQCSVVHLWINSWERAELIMACFTEFCQYNGVFHRCIFASFQSNGMQQSSIVTDCCLRTCLEALLEGWYTIFGYDKTNLINADKLLNLILCHLSDVSETAWQKRIELSNVLLLPYVTFQLDLQKIGTAGCLSLQKWSKS